MRHTNVVICLFFGTLAACTVDPLETNSSKEMSPDMRQDMASDFNTTDQPVDMPASDQTMDMRVDQARDQTGDQPDDQGDDMSCVPTTCAQANVACGALPDGCMGMLDCGACGANEQCNAGQCMPAPVDCSPIAQTPGYELCQSSANECAGVFTRGGNCDEFCRAAGLKCKAHYGGEAGCMGPEQQNVFTCGQNTGNQSDWCVCERDTGNNMMGSCQGIGQARSQEHTKAVYAPRSSWVLQCRATYAYTAQFEEHEACDSLYRKGSGRGTATFTFNNVAKGRYNVYVSGRHTENRNPAGALVHVDASGARHSKTILQRDNTGTINKVLHGTYCLEGTVVVIMDSSVSAQSDSISRIDLEPAQ